MVLILGIDPGLVNVGWGLIEVEKNHYKSLACGTIAPKVKDLLINRMFFIFNEINNILNKYHPDECAIEDIFVNSNSQTSIKLAYGRASALLAIANNNKNLFEYKPNLIKKTIAGNGKATKDQVKFMISKILPKIIINNEHEADALAIAVCHANHKTF